MARMIGREKSSSLYVAPGVWALNEMYAKKKSGTWVVMALPHRYWRLYFTDSFTANVLAVSEIEFRQSSSGADMTNGKTATVSDYVNGYDSSKVIDDNSNTYWLTYTNLPQWVQIDLVDSSFVLEYTINVIYGGFPKSWELQWSDNDTDWTTAHTVTNDPSWSAYEARTYNGF